MLLVGGEAALGLHDQAAAQVPPECAEVIHQVLPWGIIVFLQS